MKKLFLFLALMSFLNIYSFAQKEEKLTASQIIAKHLESIGTPEKRALSRTIVGTTTSEVIVPELTQKVKFNIQGKNAISSDNNKILFLMAFASKNYPQEQMAFDGKDFTYAPIPNLLLAPLTSLAMESNELIKEGLLGGTLSTSWCLQNLAINKKAKVTLASNKKVNDRETYIIEFMPEKMSLTNIKIYIDKNTFQHFRTEYKKTFFRQGGLDRTGVGDEATLTEEFSDFKSENGLNLPHTYEIRYELNNYRAKWKTIFSTFLFDQKIDPTYFIVKKNPA
jgi:hypothetical protein